MEHVEHIIELFEDNVDPNQYEGDAGELVKLARIEIDAKELRNADTLTNDELVYNLLWELCSGSWQQILKDNDDSKQRIAERIKEIVKLNNKHHG